MMKPAIVGALLNSALYLLCVFVAGLVTAHPYAWKLAIVAAGVTYLSYLLQLLASHTPAAMVDFAAVAAVILSIVFGLGAGLALLV